MVLYVNPKFRNYTGRVIYKFICPEGKVYVGKANSSRKRIRGHKSEAFRKNEDGTWRCESRWKQAIRRIGWDNLVVEILQCVRKGGDLNKRERYWIAKYNADDPEYGYNSNPGGSGPAGGFKHSAQSLENMRIGNQKRYKPVTSCTIIEDYGETQLCSFVLYPSGRAASADTGIDDSRLSFCCKNPKGRYSGCGRYWWYTNEHDVSGEREVPRVGDKLVDWRQAVVSVFPLGDGNALEQIHASHSKASTTLSSATGKKVLQGNLSSCCRRERTSHQGYHFRKVTTEKREDFDEDGKRIVKYQPELYTTKKRKRQ
tara:strand:- start:51 stop:992 length:942 start_codon:yes stop_codon:yes gene_type:complete